MTFSPASTEKSLTPLSLWCLLVFCPDNINAASASAQEVAKRAVTKTIVHVENEDDEDADFGDEDLFHQQVHEPCLQ